MNKKLAASDYKNKRVQDPTVPVGDSQARKIKVYVKTFLDKAVAKYHGPDRPKVTTAESSNGKTAPESDDRGVSHVADTPDADTTPELANGRSPGSPGLKRKREDDLTPVSPEDETDRLAKRSRSTPPPPPPPPPPEEMTEAEKDRRVQELELMKENEEAQRLEDEAKVGVEVS